MVHGSTGTNVQGNEPQIYIGEVGIYYFDNGIGGQRPCPTEVRYNCFNQAAAGYANKLASYGSGWGTQFYYLGGGGGSSAVQAFHHNKPYCFGWNQANAAYIDINTHYKSFKGHNFQLYLDIEQNDALGWDNTTQAQNRLVLNGFYDEVFDRPNTGGCTAGRPAVWFKAQPGVYSDYVQWDFSFAKNETITNTPIWTYANCCEGKWPGSYTGGKQMKPFGGSNKVQAWQFDQGQKNVKDTGDWDIMKEPLIGS